MTQMLDQKEPTRKVSIEIPQGLPPLLKMKHIEDITTLSKPSVYKLLDIEDFPAMRFGRAIRVPRDVFFKWLEGRVREGNKEHLVRRTGG